MAAMVVLELFFSAIFYSYISYSVDNELKESIVKQARYFLATYDDVGKTLAEKKAILHKTMKVQARIMALPEEDFRSIHFKSFQKNKHYYLEAYFPYEFALQRYLVLTADVTKQKRVQNKVTRGIIIMNIFGMFGIGIYAFFLSGMLMAPIRVFSRKIVMLNEQRLSPIDLKGIPHEFLPLGESVNHLMRRIQSFLNYKKELFVGTAHELKTPLAVIKTKSQVALMKRKKTQEDLTEALKQTIRSVDDMNKIVGSILEFGRAEGAQFEEPETFKIHDYLKSMCEEFSLLGSQENKEVKCHLSSQEQLITLPPLLLRQILQNLLQNALKFTPEGKKITLASYRKDESFFIIIRDEGTGIDEEIDIFAPFKRSKDSSGAGLGLFLVKSAADAIRAQVSIRNRRDNHGAVATLILPL